MTRPLDAGPPPVLPWVQVIRARATVPIAFPAAALARPRAAPLAIASRRCNRCGRCLSLGCPAISDVGAEALEIDPIACRGCGVCAPLCRARAITPSS